MICPLRIQDDYFSEGSGNHYDCLKEKCAWWAYKYVQSDRLDETGHPSLQKEYHCAIKLLAEK